MSDNQENTRSMEERLATLENIISEMEKEDVSLDQSFGLYKQGLEEIKEANAMLDEMEKAMLLLNEDGKTEEF